MKFFPLLLALTGWTLSAAFGQTTLTGRVLDKLTSRPVEFASVALFAPGDSLTALGGTLSDSTGRFVLSGLNAGEYVVKLAFVGYKNARLAPVRVVRGQTTDLGDVALEAGAQLLEAVTIRGQKADLLVKSDRQTYRAGQFLSATGGTATDVLRNLPGVSVDAEGEVNLRGANGFLVLLNGKPVQANLGTLLAQLPANSIESIEVITTPSARYDPDGKAGIIAIVTKKGTETGVSVLFNALGGLPSLNDFGNAQKPVRYGSDLTLNYRSNRWDVALSTSYLRNDVAGRRVGDVSTTRGNRFTRFPSEGERSFDRYIFTNRLALAFTPNARHAWAAGVYYAQRTEYRLADIFYDNLTTDLRMGQVLGRSAYFNSNLVKKRGRFFTTNLDYTHTFGSKATLAAGVLAEWDYFDGFTANRNLNRTDYRDTLQYSLTTTDRPLTNLRANLDFTLPLKTGRLEAGYVYRSQQDDGDFVYREKSGNGTPLLVIPAFTGGIRVGNRIHGLYGQYVFRRKKWDGTAGLRYEHAERVVRLRPQAQRFDLTLDNLFPTLNVLYRASPTWQWRAGYSRRVQRSSNFALNPLPKREHSETLEQGDPNLLPEFVGLAEVGVVRTTGRGTLLATLYHQATRNIVNRVNSVFADTILNRIFTNAGRARRLGLEVAADLSLTKRWKLYAGGTVYHYAIDGALFQNDVQFNNRTWVYSVNANTSVQLSPTLTFQANVNYLSRRITAQGEDSRFLVPNASLKKSFLNQRLSVMVQWQNIGLGFLPSNAQRITTRGRDFFTTTNYLQERDVLLINLSYSLRQLSKRASQPASEFGEKEF